MAAQGRDLLIALFNRSVLKQAKLKHLLEALGSPEKKRCLDLGSDNGVISYFLRQQGGQWSSADLTLQSVESIRSLVVERVHLLEGEVLGFPDAAFDAVVVVDMLEHVQDDAHFASELARVLAPGGQLVLNVPNLKRCSPLRWFRHLIGQTDEAHGHLRPGYSHAGLEALFSTWFELERSNTYSRFFAELTDTAIVFAYSLLAGSKSTQGETEVSKGLVVTEKELAKFEKKFQLYSAIYPFVWLFAKLDLLIPFVPGFMRIASAKRRQI